MTSDDHLKFVATAPSVESPYSLIRYDPSRRMVLVVVASEPRPSLALVRANLGKLLRGGAPTWAPLYRSLDVTGTN